MRELRRGERGMIFIAALVLLASMMVVLVALANEVALDLKMSANVTDADQALEIAKVGIDNIRYIANEDPAWRTNYTSGVWISNKAVGGGTFTAWGIDPDGNLANSPIDTVTARATATYKGTIRTLSATLTPPVHDAMGFLAYVSGGAGKIEIYNGPRIYGDLCSADKVELKDTSTPDHRGGIYVTNRSNVSSALVDGDTNVVQLSSAPAVFDLARANLAWFIARGARIYPPVEGDKYVIQDKVISPTTNPYGSPNANGIYYVQGDKDLRIVRSHITATIVVNTGRKVTFEKAAVHVPAFSYYPAVLSDREVYYQFNQNLSEAESNVDFNGDGDLADVFTPSVNGVVYAKTRIEGLQASGGTNIVRFKGALVSERVVLIGSGCIFEQDPALATNLVNQFQGDGLRLVPGTMKLE